MGAADLARRGAQALVLLILVTIVAFAVVRLTPGDPVVLMLGDEATPARVAEVRRSLGLDRPLADQYVRYVGRLLHGDLGESLRAQQPVAAYVGQRLPATAELALAAAALSLAAGVPLGLGAAVLRGSWLDRVANAVALFAQSVPAMWLGLILVLVFAVELRLLPSIGAGGGRHLVLPAVTLAMYLLGLVVRLTRAATLDVLFHDYVRTARAKGLPEGLVLLRHVLRNALLPVVTVLGLHLGTLLGGAVVTEAVFAWPGLGTLVLQAISQRDYPVIQGLVLLSGLVFVVLNFLIDLVNLWLNPRLRTRGGSHA